MVPEGTGPPLDLELPTTETLDDRVFFLSRDLEGQSANSAYVAFDELSRDLEGRSADFASVALDELADSALFFVLDDRHHCVWRAGLEFLLLEHGVQWSRPSLEFSSLPSLPPPPCVSAEQLSLTLPMPRATTPCTHHKEILGCKASIPHSDGTAGNGSGNGAVFCGASTRETSVAVP